MRTKQRLRHEGTSLEPARSLKLDGACVVKPLVHALSVDVEDWYNVAVFHRSGRVVPPTAAVVKNTERLLALIQEHDARATWFILGEVAEAFPGLVRELAQAGQELGVHGYHHHFIYTLCAREFREAIRRAKDAIEQSAGKAVLGHRAPAFSIRDSELWAFEVLAELGFQYDSSVFPFRGRRYGMPEAPLIPYQIQTRHGPLTEVPLSVLDLGSIRLPCCGGGYLRHFPLAYTRWAMKLLERRQRRAVLYLHPYEIDVECDADFIERNIPAVQRRQFALTQRLQYRNRSRGIAKLKWLLGHYRLTTIAGAFSTELAARVRAAEAGPGNI